LGADQIPGPQSKSSVLKGFIKLCVNQTPYQTFCSCGRSALNRAGVVASSSIDDPSVQEPCLVIPQTLLLAVVGVPIISLVLCSSGSSKDADEEIALFRLKTITFFTFASLSAHPLL